MVGRVPDIIYIIENYTLHYYNNKAGVKNMIGFTMIGALIVAGFVALTILSIAVAVVKRLNTKGT